MVLQGFDVEAQRGGDGGNVIAREKFDNRGFAYVKVAEVVGVAVMLWAGWMYTIPALSKPTIKRRISCCFRLTLRITVNKPMKVGNKVSMQFQEGKEQQVYRVML